MLRAEVADLETVNYWGYVALSTIPSTELEAPAHLTHRPDRFGGSDRGEPPYSSATCRPCFNVQRAHYSRTRTSVRCTKKPRPTVLEESVESVLRTVSD